jgi:hypothetical protein
MLVISMIVAIGLSFLLPVALGIFIWFHWPLVMASLLGLLVVIGLGHSIYEMTAMVRRLGSPIPARPGVACEYVGCLHVHGEVGHILVQTGHRFFGLLPGFEKWMAEDGCGLLPGSEDRGPGAQYRIRFTGIATEPGHFGHKGGCYRRVQITEVIDFSDWPK